MKRKAPTSSADDVEAPVRRKSARLTGSTAPVASATQSSTPSKTATQTKLSFSPPKPTLASVSAESTMVAVASAVRTISARQATYLRLVSNHLIESKLSPTATSAVFITKKLFGVQAQEALSGFMSIHSRFARRPTKESPPTTGCVSLEVESASTLTALQSLVLSEKTPLVRIWAQRCTLHLFAYDDWHIVSSAFKAKIFATRTNSIRLGNVTGKDSSAQFIKAQKAVKEKLERGENVTRKTVEEMGFDGALSYSLFMCATLLRQGSKAEVNAGAAAELKPRYIPEGEEEPHVEMAKDAALKEIARRYFEAHGPAQEIDFRYHYDLPAGDSKPAVKHLIDQGLIQSVVVTPRTPPPPSAAKLKAKSAGQPTPHYISTTAHNMYLAPIAAPPLPAHPHIPTLLLSRFDPALLAHKDKSIWVDDDRKYLVWTKNGLINGTVFVDGRVQGTWKVKYLEGEGGGVGGVRIVVEMFEGVEVGDEVKRDIEEEAERVRAFLDAPKVVVGYD